ncbi:MAG: general secretion pathway protein GspF [Methylococcales bacterium]|jgi:hypothetical protein|nr:general secretion pathway protein GspF [Methylococcales bacterium]MBT7409240.1 general secretion pathway protein GspF [Methylococcales bacterium]
MRRARTVKEYTEMVQQAIFEVGDLRDCMEYHFEEMGKVPLYLDHLETGVKDVFQKMKDGCYVFADGDLAFMEIAMKHAEDIPFIQLLQQINETHLHGLDIEEDQ